VEEDQRISGSRGKKKRGELKKEDIKLAELSRERGERSTRSGRE
jgi:hypothetical protein